MSNSLSVFIDESGDFGAYTAHSPFYIITMLLHDQGHRIDSAVGHLDEQITALGFDVHSIHTGPIIRGEREFANKTIDERKRMLNTFMNFLRFVDVKYVVFSVRKQDCTDIIVQTAKLSRQIHDFVQKCLAYFQSFDDVIVYYDNGQIELNSRETISVKSEERLSYSEE